MTPDQEKAMDDLMELVSSLANLTQQQALLIAMQNGEILRLNAQLEALQAIAKAKL